MTRYTSTPSKRIRTIVQLLTVAMTATLIVSITACQGEQTPPTHRPQSEDRSPIQTMEAMAAEIAALQTKAAEPTETTVDDGRRPTKEPSTAVAPATATATETPEPTATLPPPPRHRPSDNICHRSPGIQNALINTLQMSSCRIITIDELFRLDSEFRTTFNESPKQGDFAGMTNLRQLNIEVQIPEGETAIIPDQLFDRMDKLEKLTLSLKGKLTIASHAIHNLPKLKSITINSSGSLTMEKDFASEVPQLTELRISTGPNSHLKEHAINNLNRITELTIEWNGGNSDRPSRSTMGQFGYLPKLKALGMQSSSSNRPTIQPHTFQNLPALLQLGVSASHFRMADDTFSKNPKLKSIYISGTTSGHKTAFSELHKLEHLQLSSTNSGKQPEVILSPKSPLMKAILNGQESPDGYIVIPPGGE